MKKYPGIRRTGPGRYRIRVTTTDPMNGKRKEVDRVVRCESFSEAAAEQARLREELRRAEPLAERLKLRDYATKWFERKKPSLKYSTARRYAEHLDRIMDGLGDVYMDKLFPGVIADWLAAQAVELSGYTCLSMLRVLRTMTRDAQADLRLPFWPCERVVRPKPVHEYTDEEPNALTADELRALWDVMRIHEPQWFPLFALMATTGLRFAEASALQWSDVDYDGGILHVRRNQVHRVLGTPKTAGSRRRVPLTPELADILRAHRVRLIEDENPGLLGGWVFPSSVGTLLSVGVLRKPLLRAMKSAGIRKRLTPHGLRRTLNTLALEIAPAETVRRILGHSTAAMTTHYNAPDIAARRSVLGQVVTRLVQPAPAPASSECGEPGGDPSGEAPTLN